MKSIIFTASILLVSVFSSISFARTPAKKCGLPENTVRLEKQSDKLLYVNAKKDKLTQMEVNMMMEQWESEAQGEPAPSVKEVLTDFAEADGGIAYVSYGYELYAVVNYYPGDNEVGTIYQVKELRHGDYTSYSPVAAINDGEIDCL